MVGSATVECSSLLASLSGGGCFLMRGLVVFAFASLTTFSYSTFFISSVCTVVDLPYYFVSMAAERQICVVFRWQTDFLISHHHHTPVQE